MSARSQQAIPAGFRAALYLRVSTGRQAEHDLSIPDQRRQATNYCQGKGWDVVEEFIEPGASATDDRRPEFQRMIDAAAARPVPFDTIVVHSFSRFFRDQFQLEFYVRRLAKSGVRLVSITQDLGDDPMSIMMRQIMALFDEYQSKENAKHTLRAMRENARQGYWNGSRPPFGYRIVDAETRGMRTKKRIEPNPIQVDTVRLMFRLALVGHGDSGPMGMKQIALFLNERGIRTQTGGLWGNGPVHTLLTRTTYIGRHRFNEYSWRTKTWKPESEVVEVAVPAIISQEEFDEVQAMMKSRSPRFRHPRFVGGETLLGGVCFCADCGRAMTLRTSGRGEQYKYYTCSTAARQGELGCKGRTVRMTDLDGAVAKFLEQRLLAPDHMRELLAGLFERQKLRLQNEGERLAARRRQATEANTKLTRLYRLVEEGVADLSDPNLRARVAELVAIRDAANADLDRSEARNKRSEPQFSEEMLEQFTGAARERLRGQDGRLLRHNLQNLVQRVEVGSDQLIIRGSKQHLLRALVALEGRCGGATSSREFRGFVPSWLPGPDSNRRPSD